MNSISIRSSQRNILWSALVLNMLITICPFVDYYANWYITIIPLAIMLCYVRVCKTAYSATLYVLAIGFLLVLYKYWFINHRVDVLPFLIDGIMSWTPCILAIICTALLCQKIQKRLLQFALIAMMITSYTTIWGLEMFPFASRELAGSANQAMRDTYMQLNIAGFEFIYALVICLPIVIWMIRNTKGGLKFVNIMVLLSFLYCIYKSAYTTALIVSFVIIFLIVAEVKPQYKDSIIFIGILFLLFSWTGILPDIVMWISSLIESDYVADRFHQVALLLQGQSAEDIDTDTTNERLVLMKNAWDGFFRNPIWGNNLFNWHKDVLSGHSFVLDILSSSGLLGLFVYIRLFFMIFKKIFPKGYKSLSPFIRITWIAFIVVTIMNPSSFAMIYLVIFPFATIVNNLEEQKKR